MLNILNGNEYTILMKTGDDQHIDLMVELTLYSILIFNI